MVVMGWTGVLGATTSAVVAGTIWEDPVTEGTLVISETVVPIAKKEVVWIVEDAGQLVTSAAHEVMVATTEE
jgi:hypothetical protein